MRFGLMGAAAVAALAFASTGVSAATSVAGSASSVDLGLFAAGTYQITGSGVIDLIGAPGSGFDIRPDGSLDSPVTAPTYLYFNPDGSFTADGSYGPAGMNARIGALVGSFSASPSFPSDYFLIGFGTSVTLAASTHIYASVNDTYLPNNGGAFSVDVAAVPEPTSWAMMLGGFGVVGIALRRRRRATVSFG